MSNDFVNIEVPISEWGLGPNVYQYILNTVPPGSNILELGSGDSSRILTEMGHTVWSVEENIEFVGKHPNVNYIHAPIDPATNWYDKEILSKALAGLERFHTVIVDGPTTDRAGIIDALGRGILPAPFQMVFDDIHREGDRSVFFNILQSFPQFLVGGSIHIFSAGQILQQDEDNPAYWSLCGVITAAPPPFSLLPDKTVSDAHVARTLNWGVPRSYVDPPKGNKE
jgi:hypothetical protein